MAKKTADKNNNAGKESKVSFIMRVRRGVKEDFAIAAFLRGTTMSGDVHQHMIKVIREEKADDTAAFEDATRRAEILAEIERLRGNDASTEEAAHKPRSNKVTPMPNVVYKEGRLGKK